MLEELIDRLELNEFTLFDNRADGAIALELARRVESRLRGLVLSESNLDPSPPEAVSYEVASQSDEAFIDHGYTELIDDARSGGNDHCASSFSDSLWCLCTRYFGNYRMSSARDVPQDGLEFLAVAAQSVCVGAH